MHGSVTATAAPACPLPLLRLGSWHESLDRSPAPVAGLPALSLAPEILIRSDARRMRATAGSPPSPAERARILAEALEIFSCERVTCGGLGIQSAADFRAALWAWAGLPAALVDHWCELLTASLRRLLGDSQEPGPGPGAGRRLPLTLISLPGNTFTCLESVARVLISGSAAWVRPSAAEPLSALRLVAALMQAGWPADQLGFYPTAHAVLPTLIAVLPLIAGEAGRFCTTLRVILCLGDPALVAELLAQLLDAVSFSPAAPGLPLAACVRPEQARAADAAIAGRLGQGDRIVTRRPIVSRDGPLTYLAPTLIRLADRPQEALSWGNPSLLGFEAPFPLATIIRVTGDQGAALTKAANTVHQLPPASQYGGGR